MSDSSSERERRERAAEQQRRAAGTRARRGSAALAVRAMRASMSRSNQWLTAPAPPADR